MVLGGWTASRVFVLWPPELAVADPSITTEPVPRVTLAIAPMDSGAALYPPRETRPAIFAKQAAERTVLTIALDDAETIEATAAIARDGQFASAAGLSPPESMSTGRFPPGQRVERETAKVNHQKRLTGSTWVLLRQESQASLASGGQLAGSQAGLRIYYEPGPKGLAVTARVSSPLASRYGREAAVGVALRRKNVGVIIEQRIALDAKGRDRPAAIAFGGLSDVRLSGGLRLDGYVQAGVVGLKSPDAFVDGAVSVEREIVHADGGSIAIGAGAWGGAQPGAARLDIGPQIVARVPVANATIRVSAEWRERVAGDAAPASGPAVTVGLDF